MGKLGLGKRNGGSMKLLFDILHDLGKAKTGLGRQELADKHGVGVQVIGRQILILKDCFMMDISGTPKGGYRLHSWGIIDRGAFYDYYRVIARNLGQEDEAAIMNKVVGTKDVDSDES